MVVRLTLPWPPSLNTLYRHVGPRVLVSRAGRLFRKKVKAIALENGIIPFSGAVSLTVDLYPPDRRRRDIDNAGGKAILDALQEAGLFADDAQVKHLDIYMRETMPPAGTCRISAEDM